MEYVQIALSYGFGHFLSEHDEFRSEIHFYNPTARGYLDTVFDCIEGWNRHGFGVDTTDIKWYPAEGGLLPMAMFDNTFHAAYICAGGVEDWPILAWDTLDTDEAEHSRFKYELPTSQFLLQVLHGNTPEIIGGAASDPASVSTSFVQSESWYDQHSHGTPPGSMGRKSAH